jgi:hypothetical protein
LIKINLKKTHFLFTLFQDGPSSKRRTRSTLKSTAASVSHLEKIETKKAETKKTETKKTETVDPRETQVVTLTEKAEKSQLFIAPPDKKAEIENVESQKTERARISAQTRIVDVSEAKQIDQTKAESRRSR